MSNEVVIKNIGITILKDKSLQAICKNKNYNFNDFVACVMCQVKMDEGLQKCTPKSILECCVKSAQIGLKIDANGYAYLTPYKDKCSIIVGYKGYVALIKANNPKVSTINCFVISNKDLEEKRLLIEEGEDRKLLYKKNLQQDETSLEENDIAGFLAVVYYKDKTYDYCYMTKNDVNRVRAMSSNYIYAKEKTNTIWHNHYVSMGKKTAFRQLVKWCDFSGINQLNNLDNEDYKDSDKKNEEEIKEAEPINSTFEKLVEEENEEQNNQKEQEEKVEEIKEAEISLKECDDMTFNEILNVLDKAETKDKAVTYLNKLKKEYNFSEEQKNKLREGCKKYT